MQKSFRLVVVLAAFSVLVLPVVSGAQTEILTAAGELARLESGSTSLVLTISDETWDVPTSTAVTQSTPLQLIPSISGRLNAIWLEDHAGARLLMTATFDGSAWSMPYSLQAGGDPVRFDAAPHILLQTDHLRLALGDDDTIKSDRQVAHVIWQSDDRIRFSPLVFEDGIFVGWNEIVTASSAFRSAVDPSGSTGESSSDSSILLAAQETAGGRAILVSMHDGLTGRLGIVKIEVVPLLLQFLGEAAFQHIFEVADDYDPGNASAISDEMRGHIIYIGSQLDLEPGVSEFVSDRMASWLELNASDFGWDLARLADAFRSETLDVGRSVYNSTIHNEGGAIVLLEIGDFLDDNGHRDDLASLLRLRIASDVEYPADVGPASKIHVANDGSSLALSWVAPDTESVRWIENRGEGWSAVRSLALTESLDAEAIRGLIEASIR